MKYIKSTTPGDIPDGYYFIDREEEIKKDDLYWNYYHWAKVEGTIGSICESLPVIRRIPGFEIEVIY